MPASLGLEGVHLIDAIFAADRKLADLAPAQRKVRRDASVRPLVDRFFTWARAEYARLPARGLVATALGYSVRHEQALRRFLDDGRLRMDNNAAERALRPIAVDVSLCTLSSSTGNLECALVARNSRRATSALSPAA